MLAWEDVVISPSKTFAAGAIAFCIGIGVGPVFVTTGNGLIALVTACAFIAIFAKDKRWRVAAIVAALLFAGAFRYALSSPFDDDRTAGSFVGDETTISGKISSEVEEKGMELRFMVDHLTIANTPAFGGIQIVSGNEQTIRYGDRVTMSCKLKRPEPFEGFRYDIYLENRGIYAICRHPHDLVVTPVEGNVIAALLDLKHAIVARLEQLVSEPHASFLSGLLFGGSSGLSSDLRDDFSRTGTSHILAASGFNVSLFSLVFLSFIIQTPLGRRRGLFVTTILLVAYVIVAGATPPVIRAGIMSSLLLVGAWIQRKPSIVNITLLAASAMLLHNPHLLGDVGFQLSFVATVAILGLSPRFEKFVTFVPEALGFRQALAGSLAAIVLTLPIILWHFGTVSLVAPFVNLLILPFVPLLMWIAIAALVASLFVVKLGVIVMLPAWAISSVMLHVIYWYSSLPYANVSAPFAEALAVLSALIIFGMLLWHSKHRADNA